MRCLLTQGGSLGGARPKANLQHRGALWLAKFAMREDPFDVPRVEAATLRLAQLCGIHSCEFELGEVNQQSVLLLKRFDRSQQPQGEIRQHFMSGCGLLNVSYESGLGSYVELAQALARFGAKPREDCQQLFRRMLFNLLMDNTDDHLKNHGFLQQANGQYCLSPAYDILPQGSGLGYMGLALVGQNNAPSWHDILQQAQHFYFTPEQAGALLHELQNLIQQHWRGCLQEMGVSEADQRKIDRVISRIQEGWRVS